PSSRLYPADDPLRLRAHPNLVYLQAFDLHPELEQGPVYYHLFATPDRGGSYLAPITVAVDASQPTRAATSFATRDLVRPRLEYHLQRFVDSGRVQPAAGYVPVLEQESLAKDDPLPAVLIKEAIIPTSYGIGQHRGEWTDNGDGTAYREYAYRYRARLDMLVVSESPAERTELANALHDALLTDQPLLESVGYRGLTIQRMTHAAPAPEGFMVFGEEITLDGEIEVVAREELRYSVGDLETFITPL
uniref:hypothetical protein n=1 Tax=Oceanithermus sp. TaxID=2268145 RepID=UPI0025796036